MKLGKESRYAIEGFVVSQKPGTTMQLRDITVQPNSLQLSGEYSKSSAGRTSLPPPAARFAATPSPVAQTPSR
jgi:hypothetical protein